MKIRIIIPILFYSITLNNAYANDKSICLNKRLDTIPETFINLKNSQINGVVNTTNYFQKGFDSNLRVKLKPLIIKPFDVLNIVISNATNNVEQTSALSSSLFGSVYSVDELGNIKLPLIGVINVSGKTCVNLSDTIERILNQMELVKKPVVLTRFEKLKINVMGEVNSPGSKYFNVERITLLDAILAGGGLTESGIKKDIKIIREENGIINVKHINLLDASFMGSSEYQLEQNDIVYVDADNYKLKQIKRSQKVFLRDLNSVISVASGVLFLVNIFTLFKK